MNNLWKILCFSVLLAPLAPTPGCADGGSGEASGLVLSANASTGEVALDTDNDRAADLTLNAVPATDVKIDSVSLGVNQIDLLVGFRPAVQYDPNTFEAGKIQVTDYGLAGTNASVTAVDARSSTLSVKSLAGSVDLTAAAGAALLHGERTIRLEDINVGDDVKVSYATTGDTSGIALSIEVTRSSGGGGGSAGGGANPGTGGGVNPGTGGGEGPPAGGSGDRTTPSPDPGTPQQDSSTARPDNISRGADGAPGSTPGTTTASITTASATASGNFRTAGRTLKLQGTVTAVGPGTITVRTKKAGVTVVVSSSTRLRVNGQPVTLEELAEQLETATAERRALQISGVVMSQGRGYLVTRADAELDE